MGPPLTRDQLTGTVPTIRETPRLSLLISPRLGMLTLSKKVPTMKYHPTAALMSQASTVIYQNDLLLSDDELDIDMLDDAVTSGCTCGALNTAQTPEYNISPRHDIANPYTSQVNTYFCTVPT